MNEIMQALFDRLTSQLGSVPVFDYVPQDMKSYPYVQINSLVPVVSDTDSELGFNVILKVVAFSRYRGGKEINDLCDTIYSALHQWSMPDTQTYTVGRIIEQNRRIYTQDNGYIRWSVQEYRLIVDPVF